MTYAEAKKAGYTDGRTSLQRGYVSRKVDANEQTVITSHSGEKYVLLPCFTSSRYCTRQYLVAPK